MATTDKLYRRRKFLIVEMSTEKPGTDMAEQQAGAARTATANIKDGPVMQSAVDVLSLMSAGSTITLKAKGDSIPNAVAVANIITKKMLRGNSEIQDIKLDTDAAPGIGKMLSTIEITLNRF